MKKFYKKVIVFLLSGILAAGSPTAVMASENMDFTAGPAFASGESQDPLFSDSKPASAAQEPDTRSEHAYDLLISKTEIRFTEDDFYDPEFRVEHHVEVTNIGQNDTKITLDTSGLKYFRVDDQSAAEDAEWQDSKRSLKPGEFLDFYVIPRQPYGIYEESFAFCTDDGSRFPVRVSMDLEKKLIRLSHEKLNFEEKAWKYQEPERKSFTIENVTKRPVKVWAPVDSSYTLKLHGITNTPSELAPGEKITVGIEPALGLPIEEHAWMLNIYAKSIGEQTECSSLYVTFRVTDRLFSGVLPIEEIRDIPSGAPKTVQGLHLPTELTVYGAEKKTTFDVPVTWNVKDCSYDPQNKNAQSFQVNGKLHLEKDTNNDHLDTNIKISVNVNAYQRLGAPVLKPVFVLGNHADLTLRDGAPGADGHQFVLVKDPGDLGKGNYVSEIKSARMEETFSYIPKGSFWVYVRGYEKTEKKLQYGTWSAGEKIQIQCQGKKPPKIKINVKRSDIRIAIPQMEANERIYAVAAKRVKNGEPITLVDQGSMDNTNGKYLYLRGLPKGTYYVGAQILSYTDSGIAESRWSDFRKVTIKTDLPKTPPVIKKVTVSGRNVTILSKLPKNANGYDWFLGKSLSRYDDGTVAGINDITYYQKNKSSAKVQFRNLKPGTYYLSGYAYSKGYKKTMTDWSKIRKIVIK